MIESQNKQSSPGQYEMVYLIRPAGKIPAL